MLVPKPIGKAYHGSETLPDPLPSEPFALFQAWFDEAHRGSRGDDPPGDGPIAPNPNAMILATVDPDGRPSSRVVLCKHIQPDPGYITFYTNRRSRKGRALHANPFASVVFHWDGFERQVRIEGAIVESPDAESDTYFNQRHPASRVGAWASKQSKPLSSRDDLVASVAALAEKFGVPPEVIDGTADDSVRREYDIPRPDWWGGYRLHAARVELWCAGHGRTHDRAEWVRELGDLRSGKDPDAEPDSDAVADAAPPDHGPWECTRLFP